LEDKVRRIRERARARNQDPDEQERRMLEVFEKDWLSRREEVLALAGGVADSTEGEFLVRRNGD